MPVNGKWLEFNQDSHDKSITEWAHQIAVRHSATIYTDFVNGHPHLEIVGIPDEPDLWLVTFQGWDPEHSFRPVTAVFSTYLLRSIFQPVVDQIDMIVDARFGLDQIKADGVEGGEK